MNFRDNCKLRDKMEVFERNITNFISKYFFSTTIILRFNSSKIFEDESEYYDP